jgi:hypothetical protein
MNVKSLMRKTSYSQWKVLNIAYRDSRFENPGVTAGVFFAHLLVVTAVCLLVVAVDGDHRLYNKIW